MQTIFPSILISNTNCENHYSSMSPLTMNAIHDCCLWLLSPPSTMTHEELWYTSVLITLILVHIADRVVVLCWTGGWCHCRGDVPGWDDMGRRSTVTRAYSWWWKHNELMDGWDWAQCNMDMIPWYDKSQQEPVAKCNMKSLIYLSAS